MLTANKDHCYLAPEVIQNLSRSEGTKAKPVEKPVHYTEIRPGPATMNPVQDKEEIEEQKEEKVILQHIPTNEWKARVRSATIMDNEGPEDIFLAIWQEAGDVSRAQGFGPLPCRPENPNNPAHPLKREEKNDQVGFILRTLRNAPVKFGNKEVPAEDTRDHNNNPEEHPEKEVMEPEEDYIPATPQHLLPLTNPFPDEDGDTGTEQGDLEELYERIKIEVEEDFKRREVERVRQLRLQKEETPVCQCVEDKEEKGETAG